VGLQFFLILFSRECTKCGIQMEFKGKEEDEAENLRNKWKVK